MDFILRDRECRWHQERGEWVEGWVKSDTSLILEARVEEENWAERLLRELAKWSVVEALCASSDIDNLCWHIGAYKRVPAGEE